jgi:hypothetical protein
MEVQFTPDRQALVSDAIASGRRRLEILAAIELSKASLARGEGRTVTTREDRTSSSATSHGAAWRGLQPGKTRADELPPFLPSGNPPVLIHYVFHGCQDIESFLHR